MSYSYIFSMYISVPLDIAKYKNFHHTPLSVIFPLDLFNIETI